MPPARTPQRGTTLIEALLCFLVFSLGVLALGRIQSQLRLAADNARQRSEAVLLAQQDIERLRSFGSVAASGLLRSYADIVAARTTASGAPGDGWTTVYTLDRQVGSADVMAAKDVSVAVSWPDRTGATQRITLVTMIAGADPALGGALGLAPNLPASQGSAGP